MNQATTQISHDHGTDKNEHERVLSEAARKKLLIEEEKEKLLEEMQNAGDVAEFRTNLFDILKKAEKAQQEYQRKMQKGVEEGILTKEDLEQGKELFDKQNLKNKQEVFIATTDERLNFARNQQKEYFDDIDDNAHLFSTAEIKQLKEDFVQMNAMGRTQEVKKFKEEKKRRKKQHAQFMSLMDKELIGDRKVRAKTFESFSLQERKETIQKLKEELKYRKEMQRLIRKETDASKKLCQNEDWEEALPRCRRAFMILENMDLSDKAEWFETRKGIVADIIAQLEEKCGQKTPDESTPLDQNLSDTTQGKSIHKNPLDSAQNRKDKEEESGETEEISDQRKCELCELLGKHYQEDSGMADAATAISFAHARDANTMENNQHEVDEKDNLLVEDHEETEDRVICIESNVDNIMVEKAHAIAFKRELNKKDFTIINTQKKVLSATESDKSVNKNLEKVLSRLIKALPVKPVEKAYLRKLIPEISRANIGLQIRSDGAEGFDDHETTLGEDFKVNKTNFIHEILETLGSEAKETHKKAA